LAMFSASILAAFDVAASPADAAATLVLLARSVLLAICIAPLGLAALVGEIAGLRSWLWYACCSGGLASAMPFLLRLLAGVDRGATTTETPAASAESRFLLLFFLVGLIAGSIYWLIAGRSAGTASSEPEGKAA